ncbi:unnamed protein product [Heligmosomoides polygyrus]|uniref:7TM_GPCR_Srx domain-containing protein n=1 Tax=Heligmosomoides polygyrus TaxID=6339 RepID=A0A3P7WRF2_HELPZ|nr:unnamed protein product [Heligmosomoides polygyrus]
MKCHHRILLPSSTFTNVCGSFPGYLIKHLTKDHFEDKLWCAKQPAAAGTEPTTSHLTIGSTTPAPPQQLACPSCISYILVGSGRGLALLGGYLTDPITVRQCFFEKYWPHSLILGTELPSFGIILISCERLCAVLRPGGCLIYQSPCLTCCYCRCCWLAVLLSGKFEIEFTADRNWLSHNLLDSVHQSVVMLSISWGVYAFNDMVVALTYAMPGFLSVSNTVVNLIFRRDFRQRVFAVIYGR